MRENDEIVLKTRNFVSKTRNCVPKTRNFVLEMMYFAGIMSYFSANHQSSTYFDEKKILSYVSKNEELCDTNEGSFMKNDGICSSHWASRATSRSR